MNIISLPTEIQEQILHNLPWHEHFLVAAVCPLWTSILQTTPFCEKRYFRRLYSRATPTKLDTDLHGLIATNAFALEIHRDGTCNTLLQTSANEAGSAQQNDNHPRNEIVETLLDGWWKELDDEASVIPNPRSKPKRMVFDIGLSPLLYSDILLRERPGQIATAVRILPDELDFDFQDTMFTLKGGGYLREWSVDTEIPVLSWKQRNESIAELLAAVKEHMIKTVLKRKERVLCLWVTFKSMYIGISRDSWEIPVLVLLEAPSKPGG